MNKLFRIIKKLTSLFLPKYSKIAFWNIIYNQYMNFGNNNKEIYNILNKKVTNSYYKFIKKASKNTLAISNYTGTVLNSVIFVFWYTGIETMPSIIKLCYNNLVKTTKYKVIPLDKNNMLEYTNIDKRILDMVEKKEITITLFSDILRTNLLAIHNAIWLDASCFLYKDFPTNIFEYDFLTIVPKKNESILDNLPCFYYAPDLHINQTYFLVGKDKTIFQKWYNYLTNYFVNETKTLKFFRPYYISYYIFEYLYENDVMIKESCDKRVVNNRCVERINANRNTIYVEKQHGFYFDETTYMYKLSQKGEAFLTNVDGQLTPFGKLLELKGIDYSG